MLTFFEHIKFFNSNSRKFFILLFGFSLVNKNVKAQDPNLSLFFIPIGTNNYCPDLFSSSGNNPFNLSITNNSSFSVNTDHGYFIASITGGNGISINWGVDNATNIPYTLSGNGATTIFSWNPDLLTSFFSNNSTLTFNGISQSSFQNNGLPYGTYTFTIQPALSNGNAYSNPVSQAFVISPPSIQITPILTQACSHLNCFETDVLQFQIQNTSCVNAHFRLAGEIVGLSNGIKVKKFIGSNSAYLDLSAHSGNSYSAPVLIAQNVIDFGSTFNMEVDGISLQELTQQGLPDGNYNICVQAFDENNNLISQDAPLGCKYFTITKALLNPPIITAPFCGDTIIKSPNIANVVSQQPILFSWMLPSLPPNLPPTSLNYKLKIVPVIPADRDPNDAMVSATIPAFYEQEQGIQFPNYLYVPGIGLNTPLIQGQKYAFRITVSDPQNRVKFDNDGNSEVCWFVYGKEPNQINPIIPVWNTMSLNSGLNNCQCKVDISGLNPSNSPNVQANSVIKVGNFDLHVYNIQPENSNTSNMFKGSGWIKFPFINSGLIKVLVDFDSILVSTSDNINFVAVNGNAISQTNSSLGFTPEIPNPLSNNPEIQFQPGDITNIKNYLDQATNIGSNILGVMENQTGFRLPLGIDGNYKLAILSMRFTPEAATFNAAVTMLLDGQHIIGLGANNVCMDQNGICGQALLYLTEDMNLAPVPLVLNKAQSGNPIFFSYSSGCYGWFNNNGFDSLHLDATFTIPGDFIEKKNGGGPVSVNITTNLRNWSDWIATVNVDPFNISDFGFNQNGKAFYDHSITRNPENFVPNIITNDPDKRGVLSLNEWKGFYLPDLTLDLPEILQSDAGAIHTSIKNLVIDNDGVTAQIDAHDILSIGKGNLDSWYFSIDALNINILNNSFNSSSLNGKIILPITGSDPNNVTSQLDYSCTLTIAPGKQTEFQFLMAPHANQELDVPLWLATLKLDRPNNNIQIHQGLGGFKASASLNGHIAIKNDFPIVGKIDFDFMEFQVDISSDPKYINNLHCKTASPQKWVGAFPVTLKDIEVKTGVGNLVGLHFTLDLNLNNIFEAGLPDVKGSFDLWGETKSISLSGLNRPSWEFAELTPDSFKIKGPLGPIDVDGKIIFYDDHAKFGKGITGHVAATIPCIETAISASAMFGHTTSPSDFYYWYVDFAATFSPAIPLGAPFTLAGIGGGAFYNLKLDPNSIDNNNLNQSDPATIQSRYSPQENENGILAKIIVGSDDPTNTLFNATGTLILASSSFEFNLVGGMFHPNPSSHEYGSDIVKFNGRIGYYSDAGGKISGNFHLSFDEAGIITGEADLATEYNFGDGTWFFKINEPLPFDKRAHLSALDILTLNAYFQMGNKIDYPSDLTNLLPQAMLDRIRYMDKSINPQSSINPNVMKEGTGIELGGGIYCPADGSYKEFELGPLYLKIAAGIGFDVSLLDLGAQPCGSYGSVGMDGWYAQGQLYAYIVGDVGITIDLGFVEGTYSILEAYAGARVAGGFPHPLYFNGTFYVGAKVLGGLYDFDGHVYIEYSESDDVKGCIPDTYPFEQVKIINEIRPNDNSTSILAIPTVTFNLPVETNIEFAGYEEKAITITLIDGSKQTLSTKVPTTKTYRIDVTKMDVTNKKTGEKFSLNNYNQDLLLNKFLASNKRAMSFYSDGMKEFDPITEYKIDVTVQVWEINDSGDSIAIHRGKIHDPTYSQIESVTFKTGGCPKDLNESVVASYPFKNQRYFLPKQVIGNLSQKPTGFIKLSRTPGSCLLHDPDYELQLRFEWDFDVYGIARKNKDVSVSQNSAYINFEIPNEVPNNEIIKIELVKKIKQINSSAKLIESSAAINRYYGVSAKGQTTIMQHKVSYSSDLTRDNRETMMLWSKPENEIVLYSYYFKTSRFNTLSEKILQSDRMSIAKIDKGLEYYGLYQATYKCAEGFDFFDAAGASGFINSYGGSFVPWYMPPIVSIKEPRDDNSYQRNFVDSLYNNSTLIRNYYGLGNFQVSESRLAEAGYLWPNDIHISLGSAEPLLLEQELPHNILIGQNGNNYNPDTNSNNNKLQFNSNFPKK